MRHDALARLVLIDKHVIRLAVRRFIKDTQLLEALYDGVG
jgi:hypothetical protein